MKVRSCFVSNSSSSSFIVRYDREKFFDYECEEETKDFLFVKGLPESLKTFLFETIRENAMTKGEYYSNIDGEFLPYMGIEEDELPEVVEFYLDRHAYSNRVDSLIANDPWSYLNADNVKQTGV